MSTSDVPGVATVWLGSLTRARVAALGAAGAAWLSALPGWLAELEELWQIWLERSLPGGSGSFVAQVRTRNGGAAVLKVAVSAEGVADQVETLRRADGRGYVRLLQDDLARHALLLEALGTSLEAAGPPPEQQLVILADTLALAWQDTQGRRPDPGADKASQLGAFIADAWSRLGGPVSERVVEQALRYADRRAADPTTDLVVVHGDPHPGNLLAVPSPRPGAETGYVFVDPDGFVADRAYDLGVALRDWCRWLLGPDARRTAEGFCAVLAERSGVEGQRIWEWGFLERVSTGLYVMDVVGAPESVSRPYLDSAARLVT
jgi:streptomycin 6-kinase